MPEDITITLAPDDALVLCLIHSAFMSEAERNYGVNPLLVSNCARVARLFMEQCAIQIPPGGLEEIDRQFKEKTEF